MKMIRRLLYYRDLKLLFAVFITSLKISLISSVQGYQSGVTSVPPINKTKNADRNKISKYVNFYLYLRSKLGIRQSCLTYSLLFCHMLRRAGINAKINFGARKNRKGDSSGDLPLVGHCWVTVGNEEITLPYQRILQYP